MAFKAGILTYSAANQVTVSTAYDSKGTFSSSGVKEVFMGLPAASAVLAASGFINRLRNASLTSWFHGTSISTAAGFGAEGLYVVATGASVAVAQNANQLSNPRTVWSQKITGATSVTDVVVRFPDREFRRRSAGGEAGHLPGAGVEQYRGFDHADPDGQTRECAGCDLYQYRCVGGQPSIHRQWRDGDIGLFVVGAGRDHQRPVDRHRFRQQFFQQRQIDPDRRRLRSEGDARCCDRTDR